MNVKNLKIVGKGLVGAFLVKCLNEEKGKMSKPGNRQNISIWEQTKSLNQGKGKMSKHDNRQNI
jgi:hypothetical protein